MPLLAAIAAVVWLDPRWGSRIGLLAVLSFACFLALRLAAILLRISRLADMADAIAEGRSPPPGVTAGNDEVGRIARALRAIAARTATNETRAGTERDRLTAILHAMVEGVLVIDAHQRVLLANPAVRDLLSLPEESAGGGAPSEGAGRLPDHPWGGSPPGRATEGPANPQAPALIEVQRLPALHALAGRTLEGERCSEELSLHDGRPVLVQTAPIEATGGVLVFHDLSELRRLEAVRRDFVANVSHELRTPLAAIRGYSETLSSMLAPGGPASSKAVEFAGVIRRHAERLSRLLDDLLELSRLEGGRRRLARDRVDLAAATHQVLELIRSAAERRHIRTENLIAPGRYVLADRDAVEEILVNLLDNAVKYASDGGHVTVAASARGEVVRVEVRDDGPGIEPRHLPRIFERFYRVDVGRSREQGGTGLGLSIVRHLGQAMGGGVGVVSEVGKGSTFWFELPAG